jgi:hypothetical protein
MPLEFALRPRFNLERPVPRRRVVRRRLLRLALPIAAYWLAIAGVTHAFLLSTAGERAASASTTEATVPELAPLEAAPGAVDEESPANDEADTESTVTPPLNVAAPAPSPEPPSGAPPEPPALAFTAAPTLPFAPVPPALPAPPASPAPAPAREPDIATRRTVASPARAPRVVARSERTVTSSPPRLSDPLLALAPPLDEPAASRSEVPPPPPQQESAKEAARAFSLPSCDAAVAASNETIDMQGARGAADLTREAFASVLENGAYLNRCEIPARTALDICAAVQNGKVVGLTVTSTPRSPNVNACVRRAVAGLRFPSNARLDVTRTRFEAAR